MFKHNSAFINKIVKFININPNGIYIDCTFGCGGHSINILKSLSSKGKLIAFDIDPDSVLLSKNIIYDKRFMIINDNFINLEYYINKLSLFNKIDGIIFDLGISSYQLDNPLRGFSFSKNGPLDMRMNQNIGITASYWLNNSNKIEIYNVIKNFGEELYAKKIASEIVFLRKKNKFINTLDLCKVLNRVIYCKKYYKNKCTRTFQAIRIFINKELSNLKKGLIAAYNVLCKGGKLLVISFNSLEDRIVKNFINYKSKSNNSILDGIPLTYNQIKKFYPIKMLNLGKFKPSHKDIIKNNRVRSAILRLSEKII